MKEIIEQINDPKHGGYVSLGKWLSIRRYGSTPHMQLTSNAPGSDGNSDLIILEEDFLALARVFAYFGKFAQDSIHDNLASVTADTTEGADGESVQGSQEPGDRIPEDGNE
jgi:hypothetical protein